jgi:hypothetical protein
MIMMVQDNINGKVPEVKDQVTCYTCHNGNAIPKNAPPAAPPAQ